MTVPNLAVADGTRHPRDPEPVPSTKASAALTLSLIALATSVFIGGVIPAIIAWWLSRQADAEIAESDGFLLGAGRSRRARRFAKAALLIAATVVVVAALWWAFRYFGTSADPDEYNPNTS